MAPWQHCKFLNQEPSKYGPVIAEVVSAGQQSAAKTETGPLTKQLPWIHTQLCKTGQGDPASGLAGIVAISTLGFMHTDSLLCSLFTAFSRLVLEAGAVLAYFCSWFSSLSCSITLCIFSKMLSSPSPSLPLIYF